MDKKNDQKMSEIKVVWALLCKNASVDQASNMVSLFNVLDEFTLSKTPLGNKPIHSGKLEDFESKTNVKVDFSFVIQFEKNIVEESNSFEPKMNLKVIDPSGQILADNELPIVFEGDKKRMRAIITFDGMLLTKSGKYIYSVSTKSSKDQEFKEQSTTTVDVRIYA